MNRLVIVTVILFIAFLFTSVAIYLGTTTKPSAESSLNVSVTGFNLTGYYNPVGVVWNDMFNLTCTNNGSADVDNLTVTFSTNSTFEMDREIDIFGPTPPQGYSGEYKMGADIPLGAINANETKEVAGCIWNYLGDSSKVHGFAFTATLKSNGTLLAQSAIMIPPLV
jgi:hypothetical protein